MPNAFKDLSGSEQEAVNACVKDEYDVLVFQQPTRYVSLNAQNDPEGWRDRLRVLIACDAERVEAITRIHQLKRRGGEGFTLIELSIVLVIIGLIVGGVFVGQSLIAAAGVRAQITQIEKFNTAANTFFEKYGYLPGDIPAGPAGGSIWFYSKGFICGRRRWERCHRRHLRRTR